MHRNAMHELVVWKNSSVRKPLIVNGARQVGKTWLVRAFAEEEFGAIAHVVFLDNEDMKRAFAGNLDAERLLTIIGAATGTNPRDGNTLVFLDEIQECPRAITSLKMFCEQRPDVPVVAAGSLLGVALNRERAENGAGTSWPVGKVEYLDMYPLTFDEFVREIDNPGLADVVLSGDGDLVSAFAGRLEGLLREYLFVGGMPEVVQRYSETRDFAQVRAIQRSLLADYEYDFSKHVKSALEAEHVRQTWRSVPVQLAREGDLRRFSYASIRDGARGRDYRDAVAWLVDAGLVTKVPRVAKPGVPLAAYADGTYFKLYFLDVGLLGAATGLPSQALIEGSRLFTEYKGAYAEQFVCQQLVAGGHAPYYWSADGKRRKGGVDFIVDEETGPLPIEVKAGGNTAGGSIASFVKNYDLDRAVRFTLLGWERQDWLLNVPLYAANGYISSLARA